MTRTSNAAEARDRRNKAFEDDRGDHGDRGVSAHGDQPVYADPAPTAETA